MFPAPGLPKGHYLLGYDENGCYPMFQGGKCTIYECRPETCRQYDCRVLAAAQARPGVESPDISHQVKAWVFRYSSKKSEEAQQAVIDAMRFLIENTTKLPKEYMPVSESQLAAMAVRIHADFIGYGNESDNDNVMALVNKILSKYKTDSH